MRDSVKLASESVVLLDEGVEGEGYLVGYSIPAARREPNREVTEGHGSERIAKRSEVLLEMLSAFGGVVSFGVTCCVLGWSHDPFRFSALSQVFDGKSAGLPAPSRSAVSGAS
jgi:hypothetical protein